MHVICKSINWMLWCLLVGKWKIFFNFFFLLVLLCNIFFSLYLPEKSWYCYHSTDTCKLIVETSNRGFLDDFLSENFNVVGMDRQNPHHKNAKHTKLCSSQSLAQPVRRKNARTLTVSYVHFLVPSLMPYLSLFRFCALRRALSHSVSVSVSITLGKFLVRSLACSACRKWFFFCLSLFVRSVGRFVRSVDVYEYVH